LFITPFEEVAPVQSLYLSISRSFLGVIRIHKADGRPSGDKRRKGTVSDGRNAYTKSLRKVMEITGARDFKDEENH
jgi:hypothetical protein